LVFKLGDIAGLELSSRIGPQNGRFRMAGTFGLRSGSRACCPVQASVNPRG
jgi:hypothetical protein